MSWFLYIRGGVTLKEVVQGRREEKMCERICGENMLRFCLSVMEEKERKERKIRMKRRKKDTKGGRHED